VTHSPPSLACIRVGYQATDEWLLSIPFQENEEEFDDKEDEFGIMSMSMSMSIGDAGYRSGLPAPNGRRTADDADEMDFDDDAKRYEDEEFDDDEVEQYFERGQDAKGGRSGYGGSNRGK